VSAGVNDTPLTGACQIDKTVRLMPIISSKMLVNQPFASAEQGLRRTAAECGNAEIRTRLDIRFVANLHTQE
jgi:hypothetical protein